MGWIMSLWMEMANGAGGICMLIFLGFLMLFETALGICIAIALGML